MIYTELWDDTREWLAKIVDADFLFAQNHVLFDNALALKLEDSLEREVQVLLCLETVARCFHSAIGGFDEPKEIIGKHVVCILDRFGDIVWFAAPNVHHFERNESIVRSGSQLLAPGPISWNKPLFRPAWMKRLHPRQGK